MRSQFNWIERQIPVLKAGGSSPFGRTKRKLCDRLDCRAFSLFYSGFEVKKLSPCLFDDFPIFRFPLYIFLLFHKSLYKCYTRNKAPRIVDMLPPRTPLLFLLIERISMASMSSSKLVSFPKSISIPPFYTSTVIRSPSRAFSETPHDKTPPSTYGTRSGCAARGQRIVLASV